MSDYLGSRFRDQRSLQRAVVLAALLLGLLLVAVGGSYLRAESAAPQPERSTVIGRTSTVCTVPSPAGEAGQSPDPAPSASTSPAPPSATPGPSGSPSASEAPSPSESPAGSTVPSSVSAVTVGAGGTSAGSLTGAPLSSGSADLSITEQGTGKSLSSVSEPIVLTGEGSMAAAVSGVVSSITSTGESAGVMAAPCLAPATGQWFVGVGSVDADRTELILSNPDEAQAEVDLRFYGSTGRVVVPGSPGVVIGARETRTVSVSSLIDTPGPVAVAVHSSTGRVSAAARRLRTVDLKPAGADWQVPSTAPATRIVIPGVPGGTGSRILEVVNPGTERARVTVEVLGLSGAFAPAGADALEVPPESTATVELTEGLAGESGSVRLASDRPVSATVTSTSQRPEAGADIAVQSAQPPLVRQGVSALATAPGLTSELVLSNGGSEDAAAVFEVFSYAGVSLRRDDILLAGGSSATRRLTSPAPSYVVVSVPNDSEVVGSVTLTQPEGEVAGLATVPLLSPDVAGRAPRVQQDPAVGR